MRRAIALVLVVTACSGVSQGEFDDLAQQYDEVRADLAAHEVGDAELLTAEAVVAAYTAALEVLDLTALEAVYAEGLVFFDSARRITFRSRRNANADLESGIEAFGIETQASRNVIVTPQKAVVEWEMRGTIGGLPWELLGATVLEISDALIISETMYYDLASAPWGGS